MNVFEYLLCSVTGFACTRCSQYIFMRHKATVPVPYQCRGVSAGNSGSVAVALRNIVPYPLYQVKLCPLGRGPVSVLSANCESKR